MPAFLRSVSCLTPHGQGLDPLRQALARQVPCPLRPAPQTLSLPGLPPGCWIDPLERPRKWLGKPARLGRLDRLSQLSLLSAHRAAELAGGLPETPLAGVALGTAHGCHLTNELFFAGIIQEGYKGASPTLFAYTLPSSATGEIAIHFALKGPTLTLCQGRGSALSAMGTAAQLVEDGRSPWMLAGGVDTLAPGLLRARFPKTAAPAEAAVFFVLTPESGGALARIASLGMGFGEGALDRAVDMSLTAAGLKRHEIETWIGPTPDPAWRGVCGDTMAAEPLLGLAVALAEERPLPALVAAEDPGGGAEVLVAAPPA